MKRKKFIQVSGIGIALAFIPGISNGKEQNNNSLKLAPKLIRDHEGEVLNVIGDIQTHKLVGSETGNQIVEWVDNVKPGVGIPPHIHTKEDEIFRVIKGQIEIMVDNKTEVLNAGDTAFAPKDVVHSWTVVGTEKAKMVTTAFPAGIEFMFKQLSQLPPGPPDFEKVAEICGRHGITFV